jgi:hypothetical protein
MRHSSRHRPEAGHEPIAIEGADQSQTTRLIRLKPRHQPSDVIAFTDTFGQKLSEHPHTERVEMLRSALNAEPDGMIEKYHLRTRP